MPSQDQPLSFFCAILYILRTGSPWRDLPSCYGNWHAVCLRFKRGSERGLWWFILARLQQSKKLTMNIVLADSSTFKVHLHGGRSKRGQCSRGKNRAGVTTKLHLAITAEGHLVEVLLTGGNVADITVADELTADVVGCYVVEDRGYSANCIK